MLIPESRRPRETGSPIEPGPSPRFDGVRADGGSSPTVLRNPGSSARRQAAPSPVAATIPLPSPGAMIGAFRLEEAIGAGGMGAVFRALDTLLDRQVALKLLPPDQAADPEVVQRFYQEGRSAAQLDHENIARVFSIGQDGLFHHIAFEFIEGVTLRHRVEATGPLKPGEAVDVALQIAQALVHASGRGVIHRDIKPSNIILTPQGRAKVVDMGLARRFERGGDHGLTQSGMTLGTFDYISPEQARDPRDVDVRSDLYSLGCTMFHMLTGRPPFPGGTVLQKLIQHQEEPPADVRTLNPEVPAELSAVIAKLMAKDRDRRYQGPEQLVRDLLALAGSLGYHRPAADLEPWMLHGHHTWWERHLVWLLPVLGFFVVITGLVWWGRDTGRPASEQRIPPTGAARRPEAELKIAVAPGAEGRPGGGIPSDEEDARQSTAYPGTIPVSSKEDLHAVLAGAQPGSVIVLADDGPYRMAGRPWTARGPKPTAALDLTIRAESGVHPVLKRAEGARPEEDGVSSLLRFVGGHVAIEGVVFEIAPTAPESEDLAAGIVGEETELTLRGCSFRRSDHSTGGGRDVAAVLIRASRRGARGDERPPAVFAETCHFDGGQTAIRAQGPADVALRDCTMGPAAPSIWFDPTRAERSIPGELRLIHSSVLAGTGPVFRFEGGPVRVRVDDSVIAAGGRARSALVQVADPRDLNWRGRSNLYGSIGPFLETTARSSQTTTLRDLGAWEQGPAEPREVGSVATDLPVWDAAEPVSGLALERDNPTRLFLLSSRAATLADVGARQGPFGSNLRNARPSQRPTAPGSAELAMGRAEAVAKTPTRAEPTARADRARPRPPADDEDTPKSAEPEPSSSTNPMDLPSMPPMATSGTTPAEMEFEDEDPAPPPRAPEPTRTDPDRSAMKPTSPTRGAPRPASPDPGVVRNPESFLATLRRLADRGGTLRVAADADLNLPSFVVSGPGSGRIVIAAESGGARPRLRFRPSPLPGASPTDWSALVNLRAGSLRLQGLDLIVPEPEGRPVDRLAAIAVVPGTELALQDCTVTVAGRSPGATALAVQPAAAATGLAPSPDTSGAVATVEVRNSFLRSGGDAVLVAGGGRLALTLEDAMVATDGSLLHALGGPRAVGRGSDAAPPLGVRLERVAARVRGGLVHLQTSREEPEMPATDLRADSSILSTVTGDHPLFRLEGQDSLERLRDKIRWVGRRVAYHHIKTYRRDEIVQAGGLPRIYDRDDWTRAFLPTDEEPLLADQKFRHQPDAAEPAWSLVRDDLSPAAKGADVRLGPDVEKVPDPPDPDEE